MSDEKGLTLGTLDEVFEKSDEVEELETAAAPEPEKGETTAAPPAAHKEPANDVTEDDIPVGHVPRAALIDERRKRQDLEKQIAELKTVPESKQQPQERIDLFADPDKYQDHIESRIQQVETKTKITLSRDFFMDSKPDYLEKEQRFIAMAEANPSLAGQMAQSPNPARFAYETAAKQMALDEIATDPEAYKEKIRQQVLQELNQKPDVKKPTVERAPSLATASGIKDAPLTVSSLEEIMEGSAL